MILRQILTLLLICLMMAAPASAGPADLERRRVWQGPCEAEIQLPDAPVEPGTFSLAVQDEFLREGLDYRLDAARGRVAILNPRWLGRPALAVYRVFRLRLPESLALQRREELPWILPGRAGDSLAAERSAALPAREEDYGNRLRYSGSFLRGIRVGTGGQVGMESGLRLEVAGQIGPDVDVEAFLSDRNTPIQPEGRSESLEEIDRIHVRVRSPRWSALLGDIDLGLKTGEYLDYRRTVDGLRAGYDEGSRLFQAHLASARGRFHRLEFRGQEGVQGPWQLRSEQGAAQIIVLAGSERVWLDGAPLTRGEERDYVMDYGLGQLQFTARRPITSESRIQVEYQYAERIYSRSLYGFEGHAPLLPGLDLALGLAGERDDARRPLDLFLDDADRALLAAAGDGSAGATAWGSGVRRVDAGQGSWRLLDSLAGHWGHYEWAEEPPDSLDADFIYDLRFSELGRGGDGQWLGDYSRQFSSSGRVFYRFEGPGQGAWAPLIALTAPTGSELLDSRLAWKHGALMVEGEAALSRRDLNLLSALGDGDNLGSALRGRLGWQSRPWPAARPAGRLELEAAGLREQADFRPLQTVDEVEFERLYGLARQGGLQRGDLSAAFRGGDSLLFRPRASWLNRPGQSSRLAEQAWVWRPRQGPFSEGLARWRSLKAAVGASELRGLRLEQGLALGLRRLTTAWEGERRTAPAGGEQFRQGLARLEQRLGGLGEASLERLRRVAERKSPGWSRLSQADQWRSRLRWSRPVQGELDWTHRRLDYRGLDSTDTVRDLALLDLRRQLDHSSWTLRYLAENSLAAERVIQYLRVDSLQGDYSRDPINPELFVPDPDGDYLALPYETGRQRRVARLQAEGDWRWEAGPWSGDHHLEAEELSRLADPARLYLLRPSAFLTDSTQNARLQLRQDLELRLPSQRRWRLRWSEERTLDQPTVGSSRRAWTRRVSLRAQDRLGDWRGSLELERRRQESLMPGQAQERRRVGAWRTEGELSRELAKGWLARLGLEGEVARDEAVDLSGRRLRLEPSLEGRLGIKGGLNARLSWQQAWADAARVPYELLGGARVGRTWRAGLEGHWQTGRQTRLSLSWQLDALPERQAQQTGRLQVLSFF